MALDKGGFMKTFKLGEMETKFAELIWDNEPLTSKDLTILAEEAFNWKRTTTYTMLKRLCDRGIFENNKGTVTALMTKSEFWSSRSEEFLKEEFEGSLPKFILAFTKNNKLSSNEINEIQKLIDEHKEG